MAYIDDRAFTDHIHNEVALRIIYPALKWEKKDVDADALARSDMEDGIDYIFTDDGRNAISVQERFRNPEYARYDDFTLRYRRPYNPQKDRIDSEFFKIKADVFVYGILNPSRDGFAKFAVIDMKGFFRLYSESRIVIRPGVGEGFIEEGNLICPIKQNRDYSSNFIPIRIPLLSTLAEDLILLQEGFL